MNTALLSMIAQLAITLLNYFLKEKSVSDENKKIFIKMAEILRQLGAKNVKIRYESENQIDEINNEWNKKNGP